MKTWRGVMLLASLLVGCGGMSKDGDQGTEPSQETPPTGGTETPPDPGTGDRQTPPPSQGTVELLTSFTPSDFDPREPDNWASYFPTHLTAGRDKLYFVMNYGDPALWTSDGTAQGTAVVKSFSRPEDGKNYIRLEELTAVGDQLFFVLEGSSRDSELWVSHGTSSRTQRVTTLGTPPWSNQFDGNSYGSVALDQSLLFFQYYPETATDQKHTELWKSDGTAAGTALLKNLGYASAVGERLVVGNTFYFTASERSFGEELWKSDGTVAGTQRVRDIAPGVNSSTPSDFRTDGTYLYFTATVNAHKTLWKSDGSEAGTVRIYNFEQDPAEAPMKLLSLAGQTLCLSALGDDHLLRLYGVNLGGSGLARRQLIATLPNSGIEDVEETGDPHIARFTTAGDKVFFSQFIPSNRGAPRDVELWVTDGTPEGTRLLQHPMSLSDTFLSPDIAVLGNQVVTGGISGTNGGIEPWVSDGTVAGTRQLKDIETAGGRSSMPRSFTAVGNSMFFIAYDSQHGNSLWLFTP